jgi:ParB family chromosome partitioning protein
VIANIAIGRLAPHPDNPRKDLGDLAELAGSISARGVLQNLTVVPRALAHGGEAASGGPEEYTVVIGHRRLAAARMAGLAELPCAITDMDRKTQIGTMLLENIQRSALTLLEEADGFQMMIDLGDSVKGISNKTGLSETTVRRRVRIATELDREVLQRIQGRAIKLDDYEKLYKIADEAVRAEVLEKIGTHEFDWACASAVGLQERRARREEILMALSGFANEVEYGSMQKANIVERWDFYRHEPEDVETAKGLAAGHDAGTEYFYTSSEYGATIVFTKDGDRAAAAEKDNAKNTARENKTAKLKGAFAQAYALRLDFAKWFSATAQKAGDIESMAIDALYYGDHFSDEVFRELHGIEGKFRKPWEGPDKGEDRDGAILRILGEKAGGPRGSMFAGAYCRIEDKDSNCCGYNGDYVPNTALDRLYGHLSALGYAMSGDESALLDGTHPLYSEAGSG